MVSLRSKSFAVFALACSVAATTEAPTCTADGGQECQTLGTQMLQIGTQMQEKKEKKSGIKPPTEEADDEDKKSATRVEPLPVSAAAQVSTENATLSSGMIQKAAVRKTGSASSVREHYDDFELEAVVSTEEVPPPSSAVDAQLPREETAFLHHGRATAVHSEGVDILLEETSQSNKSGDKGDQRWFQTPAEYEKRIKENVKRLCRRVGSGTDSCEPEINGDRIFISPRIVGYGEDVKFCPREASHPLEYPSYPSSEIFQICVKGSMVHSCIVNRFVCNTKEKKCGFCSMCHYANSGGGVKFACYGVSGDISEHRMGDVMTDDDAPYADDLAFREGDHAFSNDNGDIRRE